MCVWKNLYGLNIFEFDKNHNLQKEIEKQREKENNIQNKFSDLIFAQKH